MPSLVSVALKMIEEMVFNGDGTSTNERILSELPLLLLPVVVGPVMVM